MKSRSDIISSGVNEDIELRLFLLLLKARAVFAIFRSDGNTARECRGEWCQPCCRFLFPHLHLVAVRSVFSTVGALEVIPVLEKTCQKKSHFLLGNAPICGGGTPCIFHMTDFKPFCNHTSPKSQMKKPFIIQGL